MQLITQEAAKAQIGLALTKIGQGIQKINDAEARLVYNEDNLAEIKAFITNAKAAKDAVEAERKAAKKPYKEAGEAVDAAAKDIAGQFLEAIQRADTKYNELCRAIAKREKEQELENARIANIKNGINNNMVTFANKIAAATTTQALIEIERLVNLEKGNKGKYQEFLPDAVSRYEELTKTITDQKTKVKELEDAERQLQEAKDAQNDQQALDLMQKVEEAKVAVETNKIEVQEAAVNEQISPAIPAQEVIPQVKARRTTWKWEIVDMKETVKKMPDWVLLETNKAKIDDYLKAKRAEGVEGKTEFTVAGIRFYEHIDY